jgi:hypothetical protein
MSAYMRTRLSSPLPPLSPFFFVPVPFSCSTAPQAFSRPDRVLSRPARADAVKAGRSSAATPSGARPLQQSSTTGRLDGSVDYSCLLLIRLRVSARYSDHGCACAGLATKSMARAMIASTYIRQLRSGLPRCCLHGRSRRKDGTHLIDGRSASADLRCGHAATHPTRPTHPTGVSELS